MIEQYTLPVDCIERFAGRVVLLTGVGRSGTSILGKLVGSMMPSYYLFEPAVMKLVPTLCALDADRRAVYGATLRALLFEDYILPMVHGRTLNFNIHDDSYIENYIARADIEQRWKQLRRRGDAVSYLQAQDAKYVLKTPEFQPLLAPLEDIFPQMRVVHITRNGNDVVSSAVARGWYSDSYMNESIVDWVRKGRGGGCNTPWYLDDESQRHFPEWNAETRAAAVWRSLTEQGIRYSETHPGQCLEVSYEELVNAPAAVVSGIGERLGLVLTELTHKHLRDIGSFSVARYASVTPKLQEPERPKFLELMESLGYGLNGWER